MVIRVTGPSSEEGIPMEVSLPADLVRFIQEGVKSGSYASPSEVVREGLRLLQGAASRVPRPSGFDRIRATQAVEELRRLAAEQTLGEDLTIRDLIDEGRG
jgi:putative addiction module CopG family antidote